MGQTSRKLYGIKNDVLRKKVGAINVKNSEELLFLEAPSEYKNIFSELNVPSKQDFVNDQLKESRQLEIFQRKYDAKHEAFKGHHIKKLCNTYDLMVLPISDIKGYLDEKSMKAIKEFTVEFDGMLSDSVLYILAPRVCFYDDFKGEEVKTYIIFYKDKMNDGGSSYRRIEDEDVVNQVYSSGSDFSTLRVFSQLFLGRSYTKDCMPRIFGNLIISVALFLSVVLAFKGKFVGSTIVLTIYLIVMAIYNTNDNYKGCWNEFSDRHDGH